MIETPPTNLKNDGQIITHSHHPNLNFLVFISNILLKHWKEFHIHQPLLEVIFWSFKLPFSLQISMLTNFTIFYTIVKIFKNIICSENSHVKLKINIFFVIYQKKKVFFDMSFYTLLLFKLQIFNGF